MSQPPPPPPEYHAAEQVLGKRLLEYQSALEKPKIAPIVIAFVVLIIAVSALAMVPSGLWFAVGIGAFVGLILLIALFVRGSQIVALHEGGIFAQGMRKGMCTLRFEEIDTVNYIVTYVRTLPVRVFQDLVIYPKEGQKVHVHVPTPKHLNPESAIPVFATIANQLQDMVRDRMLATLEREGTVPWTKGYALTKEGVVTPKGKTIPYSAIDRCFIEDGSCMFHESGAFLQSVISLNERNVMPGYLVLRKLVPNLKEAPAD